MKRKVNIEDFSKHLFWDVDVSLFDLEEHKAFLIHKVLEYGSMEDWRLIKEVYGLDVIKEVALNARTLDVVTLSFVANLFEIDKTEFRCYKHKQLFPTYWNS